MGSTWIKDYAFPAGFGLMGVALVYLFKGYISVGITISLYILLAAGVILGTIGFILINLIINYWKYGKEGFVFMRCRREGLDCIEDYDIGSGNCEFKPGEKKNIKDVTYQDEESGVKLDVSMSSPYTLPRRFGELNIYGFAHFSWLSQNPRNHLAFKTIKEWRENPQTDARIKDLAFLSDKEFNAVMQKPENALEHDLSGLMLHHFKIVDAIVGAKDGKPVTEQRFFDGDKEISVTSLIDTVRWAKTQINKMPLNLGFYCGDEAYRYNDTAYRAQHFANAKMLIKTMEKMENLQMMNWMQYGMIIIGILATIIIGTIIIMQFAPK